MSDDRLTIGLFWHSHNSTNLGVGALTLSNMQFAREAARELGREVDFIIAGPWDPAPSYIGSSEASVRIIDRNFLLSPGGLWRTLGECDVVLDITAGDSFTDIYSPKRYLFQHFTKSAAVLRKVPLVFSPQTIGPFRKRWSALMARRIMEKAHSVIARDHASFERAKALAPKARIEESIDVAFALPFERPAPRSDGRMRVGVNVSGMLWSGHKGNRRFSLGYDYRALVRRTLDVLASEGAEIHFIPHVHAPNIEWENDDTAHRELAPSYPGSVVAPPFPSPSTAKSYIAGLDFFIGSRMHACIAAYSAGVPLVPVSYSVKFDGLFGTLGYDWTIPSGTSTEQATELVKAAWGQRDLMVKSIGAGSATLERLQNNYRDHLRLLFQQIVSTGQAHK